MKTISYLTSGEASDIWSYVRPRRVEVDEDTNERHHYVRIGLSCDWEVEHGLEWLVRDAAEVVWVGPSERRSVAEVEKGMSYNYADPEARGFLA